MTGYTLSVSRTAEKFIQKHKVEGEKIEKIFKHIAENPYENIGFYDISQCRGNLEGLMRLRTGKYRTIFRIVNDRLIIFVIKIDSRGDVYKD